MYLQSHNPIAGSRSVEGTQHAGLIRSKLSRELMAVLKNPDATPDDHRDAIRRCHELETGLLGTEQITPQFLFDTDLGPEALAAVADWMLKEWMPSLPNDGSKQDDFTFNILLDMVWGANLPGAVRISDNALSLFAMVRGMPPIYYETIVHQCSAIDKAACSESESNPAISPTKAALRLLASNPDISPVLALQLTNEKHPIDVQIAAAGHRHLDPREALKIAQHHQNPHVLIRLAITHAVHNQEIADALKKRDIPLVNALFNVPAEEWGRERQRMSAQQHFRNLEDQPEEGGTITRSSSGYSLQRWMDPANQEQPLR